MGNLVGESFDDFVREQIDMRQRTAGRGFNDDFRTVDQLQVQNNQNAWLKLSSSVRFITAEKMIAELKKVDEGLDITKFGNRIDGERRLGDIGLTTPSDYMDEKLAKKAVLFNSLSNLESTSYTFRSGVSTDNSVWNNSAYGLGGTSQGLAPPPGLIDANIEAINRGSIRKAVVNIKAYNTFQFQLIELLYIRLGYSMLLEWGNDKFINNKGELQRMGNTLAEDIWFNNTTTYNFTKLIKAVGRYREIYQGNYDGFIGKVSNFSWNFDPDGTYNITLNLISVGDVIESLKINLPSKFKILSDINNRVKSFTQAVNSPNISETSMVTNAGTSPLAYDLFTDIITGEGKWNQEGSNYLNLFSSLKSDNVGALLDIKSEAKKQEEGEGVNIDRYSYFLTLGELLAKINKFTIPSVSGEGMINIEVNEDEMIMTSYPNQISLDPRVALVKPKFLESLTLNNQTDLHNNDDGIKTYWGFIKQMKEWNKEEGVVIYGQILNIYLNYDFVSSLLEKQTIKGEIYLFKFLQGICEGINNALGGIPNLEPVILGDNIVTIQDQNKIKGIENIEKFKDRFTDDVAFELFGYNLTSKVITSNIVREFGFKTNITPELSAMISIGATANGTDTKNYDATAFSNWNSGLRDQFQQNYKDPQTEDQSKNDALSEKFFPLTADQVNILYTHFESLPPVKYFSISQLKMRTNNQKTYKFDKKATGRRDIKVCPVTGERYGDTLWRDYVDSVIKYLNDKASQAVVEEPLKTFSDNYIHYLVQGFRGKINGNVVRNNYYFHLNDEYIKQGQQCFKGYVNIVDNAIYAATGSPSTKIGFIPISLDLTCNGISGIKIYQKLNIRQDFLPPQYPNALEFLITKVNHNISNNDWSTSLSTVSTPKTKEQPLPEFLNSVVKTVTENLADEPITFTTTTTTPGTDPFSKSRNLLVNRINGKLQDSDLISIDNPSKYNTSVNQSDNRKIRMIPGAALAMNNLLKGAEAAGIVLKINSSYRTYRDQLRVYRDNCSNTDPTTRCIVIGGKKLAAIPGTSNHGWGRAVDFANASATLVTFGTKEYEWLMTYAPGYGYKRIKAETWHFEYQNQ